MTQPESFEKWARYNIGGFYPDKDGESYRNLIVANAWEAYQAAQAALIADIVEKLEAYKTLGLDGDKIYIDKAIEIVKKAGE